MQPAPGGSHLTFALATVLGPAGLEHPWLARATDWCWARVGRPDELGAYWLKYALAFLDAAPDQDRAESAVPTLAGRLDADGSAPVPGGTQDERLTPLTLSPQPDRPSRALFTGEQIAAGLDDLERGQQDDGGWTFDWLAWSPGQANEWRGIMTYRALVTLRDNGRP
jgi:hypothetical protein